MLYSGQTIMLCSGQAAVFKNIPVGVQYNVIETPIEGYVINSTGSQGNITEGESVADFVNKCDLDELGTLTVSKEVSGEGADLNKEFSFEAAFGDITESFTLKHGDSKTFKGLPIGTEYTITEEDASAEGYVATVEEYTGKIVNAEVVKLKFVNVYKSVSEDEFGSLTVSKTVKGEKADLSKEFTFTVVFEGNDAPQSESFKLKSGTSKTFTNIPQGVTYTVTETDAAGYNAVTDSAKGVIIADYTAKVEFVNLVPDEPLPKDDVKLTVIKKLDGEIRESDKLREFAFELIVDGEVIEFTLKADESREFEIPVGAVYELHEADYFEDGFSQSIINGFGVAENTPIDVVVVNKYIDDPMTEIEGTKTWAMGEHTDVKLPDSITLRLKNGDLLVEEKVVTPNENGEWKYTFTVEKYNIDGSIVVYTIEEVPITSYRTSYDGYNITNTYVAPIKVDLPIITKIVQGENAPKSKFEFVFKGSYDTPMPDGSDGNKKLLALEGAVKLEVGAITFTDPGKYVYTVQELNGGIEGWSYDNTSYTITITVTEENYTLSSKQTIEKNDEVAKEVVFTNVYNESTLGKNIIISGKKTWNHGSNPEKLQPTSIIVEVYGDDELVAQRHITVKDNWEYSFELPRYADDGDEIVYTIDEAPIENYKKSVNGYDLTNTYIKVSETPSESQGSGNSPQTGDSTRLVVYFAIMIISLAGLILTTWFKRYSPEIQSKKSKK